jgi:hypothetical protein
MGDVSPGSISSPRPASTGEAPFEPARHGRASRAALVGATVWFVASAIATFLLDEPAGMVLFVAYAGTGIVLAARRPGQPIAWLLMLAGWGFALGSARPAPPGALLAGTATTAQELVSWASAIGWSLAFIALITLALVFPSGRLAPHGWRRWGAVAAVGTACGVSGLIMFGPTISLTPTGEILKVDVPNPFGLLPDRIATSMPDTTALYPTLFAILLGATASFVLRFRRATGIERLQYRWLAWAIVVVMGVNAIWAVTTIGLRFDDRGLTSTLTLLAYPSIPIAVAIAVLRYRLYNIDRVISRTISWSLVTAALIAIFAGSVVLLQIPLSGLTQGSTFVTAASTLLVLALFQPIVRRVQAAVDRRFDRPRIEAQRTLASAAIRLQEEVDLGNLEADLTHTVSATIRPSHVGLWIAKGGGRRDRRPA